MGIAKAEVNYGGIMKHDLVKMIHAVEVTKLIVKDSDYKIEPDAALDLFRDSITYQNLIDDKTGLYGQSALYIFSLFQEEHQQK